MRLPLGKNKTRPAARTLPAGLSAAYSPNPESRSPEGLLKLTHPSNIWCYNLIQESNYQMYPSNTEKKEKVPNQQQPETQAVSFTLKTAQLVSCRVCRPPHQLLHFSHHAVIREREICSQDVPMVGSTTFIWWNVLIQFRTRRYHRKWAESLRRR